MEMERWREAQKTEEGEGHKQQDFLATLSFRRPPCWLLWEHWLSSRRCLWRSTAVLEERCCLENTWSWGNKDKGQMKKVYMTKSQRNIKGKVGDFAWQEAWVEFQSRVLYLTLLWKAMLSIGTGTTRYDGKGFAAWYQIGHLPVVWWFLRYFFAWSRSSSSCEHLTSLKHTRLCLPVYSNFTLSHLFQL